METSYDIGMVDPADREEIVRLSLQMTRKKLEIKEMCKILGCSRQTLGPFLSGGPMGAELLDKGEALAKEMGFWLPDVYPSSTGVGWSDIATDLIGIGEFLRTAAPEDEKTFRFARAIDFYYRTLESNDPNR